MRQVSFAELKSAFDQLGSGPVLLHTDLLKVGFPEGARGRQEICGRYVQYFFDLFADRCFLLPTFNYDFCKTGIYDVIQSEAQVGVLPDYFRQHFPEKRTHTPVFNFCILNNSGFSLRAADNCFGERSTFAELLRQDGIVAFFGADFSSNTFLHHIEELCNVSYRFHKQFLGTIFDGEHSEEVTLTYRVRPLEGPTILYDWARLQAELVDLGILRSQPIGSGQLLFYHTQQLADFWCLNIQRTERYLLT